MDGGWDSLGICRRRCCRGPGLQSAGAVAEEGNLLIDLVDLIEPEPSVVRIELLQP